MSPNFLSGYSAHFEKPTFKTNASDISASQPAWACPLAGVIRILNGESALGHSDDWADVGRAALCRLAMRGQEWIAGTN